MSQPPENATDLGQSLPTGLIGGVDCEAPQAAGADGVAIAHCSVSWTSVKGEPQLTHYVVRLFPNGCFAAGARPRFPLHRDTTIATYSEHPLNALVSAGRACS